MSEFKGVGLTGVGLTRVDCTLLFCYRSTVLPRLEWRYFIFQIDLRAIKFYETNTKFVKFDTKEATFSKFLNGTYILSSKLVEIR